MKKSNKLVIGVTLLPILISGIYLNTNGKQTNLLTNKDLKIIQGSTIEQVAIGTYDTTANAGGAIVNDGVNDILYTWGYNDIGQMGVEGIEWTSTPTAVDIDGDGDPYTEGQLSNLTIGNHHGGIVTNNRTLDTQVYTWGYGAYGQLGNGSYTASSLPAPIAFDFTAFIEPVTIETLDFSNDASAMIFNDGTSQYLYTWGYNLFGQLGIGHVGSFINTPQLIGSTTTLNQVDAFSNNGYSMEIAVTNSTGSTLYGWGYNQSGQLGDGTKEDHYLPVMIDINQDGTNNEGKITDISGAELQTGVVMDNQLYTTGVNRFGSLGNGTTTSISNYEMVATPEGTINDLSYRYGLTGTLLIDDQIYSWGDNTYGEAGLGDYEMYLTPTLVDTSMIDGTITQIATGYASLLVVFYDGTNYSMYATGTNNFDQLAIDGSAYRISSLTLTNLQTDN